MYSTEPPIGIEILLYAGVPLIGVALAMLGLAIVGLRNKHKPGASARGIPPDLEDLVKPDPREVYQDWEM